MVNLKCDETCKGGDNCTNSRIYISGLPKGCTADDITDMFGGLGTIARERPQGRGVFPDMMPYRVKFYGNDDCLLHYEDPHAAHAATSSSPWKSNDSSNVPLTADAASVDSSTTSCAAPDTPSTSVVTFASPAGSAGLVPAQSNASQSPMPRCVTASSITSPLSAGPTNATSYA